MAEEISIKEAQELLGVTKATVYAHIRKGCLHRIKYLAGRGPGGLRTFLDRAEVEALKPGPAAPTALRGVLRAPGTIVGRGVWRERQCSTD